MNVCQSWYWVPYMSYILLNLTDFNCPVLNVGRCRGKLSYRLTMLYDGKQEDGVGGGGAGTGKDMINILEFYNFQGFFQTPKTLSEWACVTTVARCLE